MEGQTQQSTTKSASILPVLPSSNDARFQTLKEKYLLANATSLIDLEATAAMGLAKRIHRATDGLPLDFDNHPYLIGIYEDDSPNTVIRKSVQSGISDRNIVLAIARMRAGRSVFYVLPTQPLRNRFVARRVDTIINTVPYYRELQEQANRQFVGGRVAADMRALKQLGNGAIAFVGSNAPAEFIEFVADCVIIDEIDRCDQENLPLAKDRTANSPYREYHVVGNPTLPKWGIDKAFQASDMKFWFIPCDHCGEWQVPDWCRNVVRPVSESSFQVRSGTAASVHFVCSKCEKPMNRRVMGEWVAKHPERPVSGYAISQLFSGALTLTEMHDEFVEGQHNIAVRQRFNNSILGMPHEEADAVLSESALDACVDDYAQESLGEGCYIGVDVGSVLNVVVIDDCRVIRMKTLPTLTAFDELARLAVDYKARLVVIDGMPETRLAKMAAKAIGQGKALLCYYGRLDKNAGEWAPDWWKREISIDRTQSMDDSHALLTSGTIRLPRDARSVKDFYAQMCAPVRKLLKTGILDQGRYVWDEGNEPDHYRHAFNYACIARAVNRRQHGVVIGKVEEKV